MSDPHPKPLPSASAKNYGKARRFISSPDRQLRASPPIPAPESDRHGRRRAGREAFPDVIDSCKSARTPAPRPLTAAAGSASRPPPVEERLRRRDPDPNQIIHSIGSRPPCHPATCFINPATSPDATPGCTFGTPKYPAARCTTSAAGKERLPADLSTSPTSWRSRRSSQLPQQPDRRGATPGSSRRFVAFAKKNNIVMFHDSAYAALVFDGKP
jgi:aspartate/methionine/tyrosine aminotransferase